MRGGVLAGPQAGHELSPGRAAREQAGVENAGIGAGSVGEVRSDRGELLDTEGAPSDQLAEKRQQEPAAGFRRRVLHVDHELVKSVEAIPQIVLKEQPGFC